MELEKGWKAHIKFHIFSIQDIQEDDYKHKERKMMMTMTTVMIMMNMTMMAAVAVVVVRPVLDPDSYIIR